MSDYEFGVGEYQMRNGSQAWVKFKRTHYDGRFVLVGERESFGDGRVLDTWLNTGENKMTSPSPYDLMSPVEHRYANVYPKTKLIGEWYPCISECDQVGEDCSPCIGYLHEITHGDEVEYEFIPKEDE